MAKATNNPLNIPGCAKCGKTLTTYSLVREEELCNECKPEKNNLDTVITAQASITKAEETQTEFFLGVIDFNKEAGLGAMKHHAIEFAEWYKNLSPRMYDSYTIEQLYDKFNNQ